MTYSGSACTGGNTHSVSGPHEDEAGRRCGIGFNPGEHQATDKVKGFFACAMKAVIDERDKLTRHGNGPTDHQELVAYGDAMRCFATALTQLEHGQMMAVKGLHTRKNAGIG